MVTAVLWMRSYDVKDYCHVADDRIASFDGWIACESGHYNIYVGQHGLFPLPGVQARWGFNSFGTQWQFRFRFYWLAVLLLVLPAKRVLTARSRRPVGQGLCHTCHYNLNGNISGVCPECGSSVGGQSLKV